ncbi:MAG: ATP synthase F1 subunit delta [Ignavibacteriales bacterium]|nr:MAG: ATP synthase F1 subunit delta [Ignavibacteriales bacterium]
MADHKVSIRYASSLLETSLEKRSLDIVYTDVDLIYKALKSSNELKRLLASPVIKAEAKAGILKEIFAGKVSSETTNFLNFVVEKNRIDLLQSIIEKFFELRNEKLGLVEVEIKTAFEFTREQTDQLKKNLEHLTGKKVVLNFVLDTNVIGGFIARVGDSVYDASIQHQLDLLKKKFLQGGPALN